MQMGGVVCTYRQMSERQPRQAGVILHTYCMQSLLPVFIIIKSGLGINKIDVFLQKKRPHEEVLNVFVGELLFFTISAKPTQGKHQESRCKNW